METYKELYINDYEMSLQKLLGKPIIDVRGYLSDEYGKTPVFIITQVDCADGEFYRVRDNHINDDQLNIDTARLWDILRNDPNYEDE